MPVEAALLLEEVCDAFEATWRANGRPDIGSAALELRNHLYDVFQLFDAPDATVMSGDRPTTTVATQALFWMNSPLVTDSAAAMATTLLSAKNLDDAGRVRTLYLTAYGRPPTPSEESRLTNAAARFAESAEGKDAPTRRTKAWALVCQVVLAANEFVYVN